MTIEDAIEAGILRRSVLKQYRKTRGHIEKKADSLDVKIAAEILRTTVKDPYLESDAKKLEEILGQTFWGNAHALDCQLAAMSLMRSILEARVARMDGTRARLHSTAVTPSSSMRSQLVA